MVKITCLNFKEIQASTKCFYFGWEKEELKQLAQDYQSKFYGSIEDGLFEVIDNNNELYYAIFKGNQVGDSHLNKNFLLFKDKNRVLINIGSNIYRFLINEKKVTLNNEFSFNEEILYEDLVSNEIKKINLDELINIDYPYLQSISSTEYEIMIILDDEGMTAINWDTILWHLKCTDIKYPIYDGSLVGLRDISQFKLEKIENQTLIVHNYDMEGFTSVFKFNIETGSYSLVQPVNR